MHRSRPSPSRSVVVALLFVAAAAVPVTPSAQTVVFSDVNVVTLDDRGVLEHQSVVIRGGVMVLGRWLDRAELDVRRADLARSYR